MVNYAEKYSAIVDERFRETAKSAAFVNSDYDFEGVQTVKVYSIPTAPMHDYVRTGRERYGAAEELENSVQTMTLSQDRSFTFTIDRRSNTDSMGAMAAGAALSRQLEEVVIPEVDTYRFAKMTLCAGCMERGEITSKNAYEAFLDANSAMTNKKVPIAGRSALVTPGFYKKIKLDPSFIQAGDAAQAMRMNGQVGMIDGVGIFLAPSCYLPGGMEFLIAQSAATCAPQKLEDYKIHDNPPGTNGWLVEGRIFHDAFVLANKAEAIYCHMGALGEVAIRAEEGTEAGKKAVFIDGAEALLRAGAELRYKAGASQTAPTLDMDVSAWAAVQNGEELALTDGQKLAVAVARNGRALLGGVATV